MRLQTRIQLSTTVVSIVLLLIANTSIYLIFKHMVISSEQSRLAHAASNIARELNANKKASAEQVLQSYSMSGGMIYILNEEGVPIIQKTTGEYDEARRIPSIYRDDMYEDVAVYKGSSYIMVSIPAIFENGEVVNLQVFENADALFSNIQELKWVMVFATMSVVVILFVAGRFLGQVISSPIQRLTKTMKIIEENKTYDRIDISSDKKDEITEMAATFNSMISKLEESYAKQERFVSDASHELKTPLTVIDSYINLLSRWGKERPDIVDEAIESISSEAGRMKYLTEQLLQLAKPEEVIRSHKENINIIPAVEKTIQRLKRTYGRDIQFRHEQQEVYLAVHEQSFVQVLIILLDNASKYGSSHIEVELKEDSRAISLSVKDDGIGIAQEAISHVFDRMYRVDKARSRKTGGSGLGLAIAKRIVELHDGEILLESVEGKGSTFTLLFPKLEEL